MSGGTPPAGRACWELEGGPGWRPARAFRRLVLRRGREEAREGPHRPEPDELRGVPGQPLHLPGLRGGAGRPGRGMGSARLGRGLLGGGGGLWCGNTCGEEGKGNGGWSGEGGRRATTGSSWECIRYGPRDDGVRPSGFFAPPLALAPRAEAPVPGRFPPEGEAPRAAPDSAVPGGGDAAAPAAGGAIMAAAAAPAALRRGGKGRLSGVDSR